MKIGTKIASRDDGAALIYDGLLDAAGIRQIPVAHIELDGRKGPTQSVLSAFVHPGWTIDVSDESWEALHRLM